MHSRDKTKNINRAARDAHLISGSTSHISLINCRKGGSVGGGNVGGGDISGGDTHTYIISCITHCTLYMLDIFLSFHLYHFIMSYLGIVITHLFDAGWQIVREGRPQPFEDHRAEKLHGIQTFEDRLIGTGDFRKQNADAIHVDLVPVKLQFGAELDSDGPSVLLDQFRGHVVRYTKHVVANRSIVGKVGRKVKRKHG
jgi:hypothetical protein